MDNGIEKVDAMSVAEAKVVKDERFQKNLEENDVIGCEEGNEVEDDVFEEATDSPAVLKMQVKLDPENAVENVVDSESGLVVANENSNVGFESETFEEAIGVPAVVGFGIENVDDLVEGQIDGVQVSDKIDEGGTGKEVADDVVFNEENGVPESSNDTIMKLPEVEMAGKNSDQNFLSLDDMLSIYLSSDKVEDLKEENLQDGGDFPYHKVDKLLYDKTDKPYKERFENNGSSKVKMADLDSDQNIVSHDDMLSISMSSDLDSYQVEGLKEKTAAGSVVSLDDKIGESIDDSAGISLVLETDSCEEINGFSITDEVDVVKQEDVSSMWKAIIDNFTRDGKEDEEDSSRNGSDVKLNDASAEGHLEIPISEYGHVDGNVEKPDEEYSIFKAIIEGLGHEAEDEGDCRNQWDTELNDDSHEIHLELQSHINGEVVDDKEKISLSPYENGTNEPVSDDSDIVVDIIANKATVTTDTQCSSLESSLIETNEKIQLVLSASKHEVYKSNEAQATDKTADQVSTDDSLDRKTAKEVITERKVLPELSSSPVPPPARPAGLGRAAPLLGPASRAVQQPRVNGTITQAQAQQIKDSANGESDEHDETREKLQMIRVKFLRLAHRLGQTPHNVVVAQVLYRLGLAEQLRGRNGGRVGAFSFDRASSMAEQLEAVGQEPLDFSCTILVLGKAGVGKSATINSIFDEVMFNTDAFHTGTKTVQDVVGTVQGINVRVIDTPGLLVSGPEQRQNEKILHSVKRFIKKNPPDIVLYLDRLDTQSRDFLDQPLLRTITDIFGASIWFSAIVVLTHAASAPPDGPNGTASSYDMFVTQRSHVVQQAIRQAAGDLRLMNPVALVENHSACRTNRAGQRVLPNGQVWKPHLLLLSFASKVLAEANTLLKLQDSPPGKPFASQSKPPPLPYLLSSLLQSRPQVKLPDDQGDDDDDQSEDLNELSDSDNESEYESLPPFHRLSKAQVAQLSKSQRKAYFDELEYRETLFMKKQLKDEKRRKKMMKKLSGEVKDMLSDSGNENVEESGGAAASVPVPMPDLALPASFDSDNPAHRYRCLDSNNQWLVRPVLETQGWDHDVGYEGINVERLFILKEKNPVSFSGQVTKDKKDANVQMELASTIKHNERKSSSFGFDMHTVGKELAYTLRGETRLFNLWKNMVTAGISGTLLGDALSGGLKVEDKFVFNNRFRVVMTGGAMTGRGDIAYGGSLEAQLRDKDFPLGRFLSSLGLSVMDWHGDLAVGFNVQSQVPVGRFSNLIARASLNNRGTGQMSLRLNSTEQLQIALLAFIPLFQKLLGYSQQMQFGQ